MPTCLQAEKLQQQEGGGGEVSQPCYQLRLPEGPSQHHSSFVELWAPSWVNPWAKGQGWGSEVGALHLLGTAPQRLEAGESLIRGQTNGH